MTKTYRGALLLALVISLLLPATAAAAVPSSVTKGLDWLHTRQRSDGGFSYTSSSGNSSDTPWIMLAIAAGNNGPGRWQVSGHSPVTFLQHTALDTAAKNSGNAPEYYALCILAYRAAGRTDLLTTAGSTQIDLIAKLESYQSLTDGYYSPNAATAVIDATAQATETTTFAVLGLVAAHESGPPLSAAVTWLRGQANAGAGPDQRRFWLVADLCSRVRRSPRSPYRRSSRQKARRPGAPTWSSRARSTSSSRCRGPAAASGTTRPMALPTRPRPPGRSRA